MKKKNAKYIYTEMKNKKLKLTKELKVKIKMKSKLKINIVHKEIFLREILPLSIEISIFNNYLNLFLIKTIYMMILKQKNNNKI
jgi:hypothetical protein